MKNKVMEKFRTRWSQIAWQKIYLLYERNLFLFIKEKSATNKQFKKFIAPPRKKHIHFSKKDKSCRKWSKNLMEYNTISKNSCALHAIYFAFLDIHVFSNLHFPASLPTKKVKNDLFWLDYLVFLWSEF